jgi:hypothetical protein
LANQRRSRNLSVYLDQAAVGFLWKRQLSDPRDKQWIDDARQKRKQQERYQGRTKVLLHGDLL